MHWTTRLLKLSTLVATTHFLFLPTLVHAQSIHSNKGETASGSAMVSLIETNPADLIRGRYRIAHESLLLEGVSFAWVAEVQENFRQRNFEEKNMSAGFGLQFYPQSVSLNGLFVRGESDVALATLREDASAKRASESGHAALIRVAGDVGWRVRLSDKLTGSAAYGLRTIIPQDLWNDQRDLVYRWLRQKSESPEVRVQINLGVLL